MPKHTPDEFRKHLAVAQRFTEAAQVLLESGYGDSAVSRMYYGLYTATVALVAVRVGRFQKRWDHQELHKAFLDNFARRGFLFSKDDAKDYAEVLQQRMSIDYQLHELSPQKARELILQTKRLVDKVRKEVNADA